MLQLQPDNYAWSRPITILSPLDLVGNLSPRMHVAVLAGADDKTVPPSISRDYAEALKTRINHVALIVAPGRGHDMLLEPVTYDALKTLVEGLQQ
jgi:pimeloyl-ACP methyl ester carboxylesterase